MCPGTPGEISRGGPLEVQNGTQQDRNKMIHLVNFGGKKIVYMLKMGGFEMEANKIWLNGRHGQIWGGKKIIQMPKMGGKTATHTYWLSKRECPPREQIPGLADSWWPPLTHWGRDKMAAIFKTTFTNAFPYIKMYEFRLRFHWSLFPMFQLTIFQHWFRKWLGAVQATSLYLNQWWIVYQCIYASLGLNELRNPKPDCYHTRIQPWYQFRSQTMKPPPVNQIESPLSSKGPIYINEALCKSQSKLSYTCSQLKQSGKINDTIGQLMVILKWEPFITGLSPLAADLSKYE